MMKFLSFLFSFFLWVSFFHASKVVSYTPGRYNPRRLASATRLNNIFSDISDVFSGGKLVDQTRVELVYGRPLGDVSDVRRTLAIQERAISFTGEDFDVYDLDATAPYCRVRGAMLHLPGKDKMRVSRNGKVVAILDRKLVAITPTYDIYRGESGEKIGWLEKVGVALTDTFEFHGEKEGGFGPFRPGAAFKLEGGFLDRRFVMKNSKGDVVARVTKDQIIEFDQFNHYQVELAPGMDPILVIACACAIDEELDEEHKKKREKEQEARR
jgi:uncharacterized protein YxjI